MFLHKGREGRVVFLQFVLARLPVLDVQQLDVEHEGGTCHISRSALVRSELAPRAKSPSSREGLEDSPPGMGPTPREPYPRLLGIVSVRFSPGHMSSRPCSQPLMTWPRPTGRTQTVTVSSSGDGGQRAGILEEERL